LDLAEDIEVTFSEYNPRGRGPDKGTRAYAQINQFSAKGKGTWCKVAFEDHLHAALSIRNDIVPVLKGDTEED